VCLCLFVPGLKRKSGTSPGWLHSKHILDIYSQLTLTELKVSTGSNNYLILSDGQFKIRLRPQFRASGPAPAKHIPGLPTRRTLFSSVRTIIHLNKRLFN
jgi:hypothetical protein